MNTSSILLDAVNVRGAAIEASAGEFFLYNQKLRSLDLAFRTKLKGSPVMLVDVPAFPEGVGELAMRIDRYRFKQRFVNVPSGAALELREMFFLDPEKAKVKFPTLAKLKAQAGLKRLLDAWTALDDLPKAGLLNLYAKSQTLDLPSGGRIFDFVETLIEARPARIFVRVGAGLIEEVAKSPAFGEASGISHSFPKGWKRVERSGSFKTKERQANLQVTFAQDTKGDGLWMADIDIDDNQGLAHAFDVIGHKLTGRDTHPYDIHQMLVALQGIEPGYELA